MDFNDENEMYYCGKCGVEIRCAEDLGAVKERQVRDLANSSCVVFETYYLCVDCEDL